MLHLVPNDQPSILPEFVKARHVNLNSVSSVLQVLLTILRFFPEQQQYLAAYIYAVRMSMLAQTLHSYMVGTFHEAYQVGKPSYLSCVNYWLHQSTV